MAMLYFGLMDVNIFIHHFVCIVGLTCSALQHHSADILSIGLVLAEISNPTLHIRMILRHLGLRYTKSYEIAEILYIGK